MPFHSALKKFYTNGFFELTDSQISLANVRSLEKQIKHLKEDKPEIPFYQIHLNHLNFIPDALLQADMPQLILSGAIVEHNSRAWNGKLTDVALTQMMSVNGFNAALNIRDQEESPERQLTTLKKALLSLLTQLDTWNSIELDNVFFYQDHKINYFASEHFYNELLGSLAKNDSLRKLTIKPFSLIKHRNSLVNFLTQHTQLEALHLEINEANRQDWLELSQILAGHSKLESLNLDNSILDAHAYSALTHLLDENYRLKITLPEPTNEDLLKVYEPLKQRLLKSGLERFKEDHLSQAKLLQIAVGIIESKKPETNLVEYNSLVEQTCQTFILLTNPLSLPVTENQKDSWIKDTRVLPSIYRNHAEHLKDEPSLLQLHLDKLIPNGTKTAGYFLMEKALESNNYIAMKALLNAKANLFELPITREEPFLAKVLQSKGDLKRMVIEHIRQDQRLAELASECLMAYPDLVHTFGDLKTHLDQYSSHLVKKDNPYTLLFISNEILGIWRKLLGFQNPATTRGKECAQIYLDLDKSLQIIHNDPEITYTALREIQTIMQRIKENSIKALRGILNKSLLHEKVINLVDRFDTELEASKDQINVKKDETIKHRDEEIKKLKESHEREKSILNEKFTKMETENAAMKAQQAKMEETLNALLKQMASNNTHSSEKIPTSQDQIRTEAQRFFRP